MQQSIVLKNLSAMMGIMAETNRMRPQSGWSPVSLAAMVVVLQDHGCSVSLPHNNGSKRRVMEDAVKMIDMASAESRLVPVN